MTWVRIVSWKLKNCHPDGRWYGMVMLCYWYGDYDDDDGYVMVLSDSSKDSDVDDDVW
jgi:hypothetical protein